MNLFPLSLTLQKCPACVVELSSLGNPANAEKVLNWKSNYWKFQDGKPMRWLFMYGQFCCRFTVLHAAIAV